MNDLVILSGQKEAVCLGYLLNTLSGEPLRIVQNLIGESESLNAIWAKLVKTYDNTDSMLMELRGELKRIPFISSKKDLAG